MRLLMNTKFLAVTGGIASLLILSMQSWAGHSWGSYKWDDADGTLDLVLVDNLTQAHWSSALVVATNDWNTWSWDNDGSSGNILNSVAEFHG